jgi:hypothetical protein
MKTSSKLLSLLLLVAVITFESCNDDDEVKDVLITSHRASGKFYKLDKSTGAQTEIFTATYDGATLNEIRGFVYHPKQNLFYASINSYKDQDGIQLGHLYTIHPKTKVATRINENDGNNGAYDVWDAIVNWAVASDDSLVAVGDFNSDGNGIVKFGIDGGRSLKTAEVDFCCGLGLVYDKSTKILLVGNEPNGTEEVRIDEITQTGTITDTYTITEFDNFPAATDLSVTDLYLKAMAKDKDGTIYGIVYNVDDTKESYFVKVDIENLTITYISTLGEDSANQYNTLAFIPGKFAN